MLKDAKKDEDWCGALRRQGVNVDKALVRMKGNEAAYLSQTQYTCGNSACRKPWRGCGGNGKCDGGMRYGDPPAVAYRQSNAVLVIKNRDNLQWSEHIFLWNLL